MATFVVSGRYRESDHIRYILLNTDILTKNTHGFSEYQAKAGAVVRV